MKKKISNVDLKNYKIIRKNVKKQIKNVLSIKNNNSKKVLEIAPQIHNDSKGLSNKKIFTLDINKNSKCDFIADICKNNSKIIPSNFFDIVICTEVLEHTKNPFKAVKELFRILKNKGLLLVTTPFDFRIHGPLPDCWRFTEHGLKELFKNFSTIKIESINNNKRFLMPICYTVLAQK